MTGSEAAAAPIPTVAAVPQRLVLVLPSSGEFDSRTYRIATSAIARGHQVTVLARWQAGLPIEELHPAGYRIVRIAASSADGLPFRGLRATVGRWVRARLGTEFRADGAGGGHRGHGRGRAGPGDLVVGRSSAHRRAGVAAAACVRGPRPAPRLQPSLRTYGYRAGLPDIPVAAEGLRDLRPRASEHPHS